MWVVVNLINKSEFVEMFGKGEKPRKTMWFATVDSIDNGRCRLIFDGESEPSVKYYNRLESYEPQIDDRVMVLHNVILGKLA